MSRIYNRAFKIGVVFNLFFFAILNVWSYVTAIQSPFAFSGGVSWGFPLAWNPGGDPLALMINVAAIALSSFIVGFVFRYCAKNVK